MLWDTLYLRHNFKKLDIDKNITHKEMFTTEFLNFTCISLSVKGYWANEFNICVFFSQHQQRHQKTASVDSQQSSSSDQPFTSDLTNSHSPSISTNHITSPSLSPLSSPRLARTLSGGADSLPVSLEKVIKIKKSRDPLGGFQIHPTLLKFEFIWNLEMEALDSIGAISFSI